MRVNRTSSAIKMVTTKSLTLLTLVVSLAARGQAHPAATFGLEPGQTSAIELGFDYTYFHVNAPPMRCGCFSMNGGGGSLVINMPHGMSLVADLAGAHASRINGTAQSISIFNYLAGPRYSYRTSSRFTPYGQVLFGGSEELSNYAYVANRNAFALSAGGGVSRVLNRHLAWTLVEADYVYSRLPNAVNNHQNDLRVSTGLTLRLGPR
jgi:outer membrane immunogenic protein